MASQAYEIVNNLKDLPENKKGFIEVVERYKNGRIKSIAKYLAKSETSKEEAKKLCEKVLSNVKDINHSIDVVNNSMNIVKGLAGLNAILGAANLCATAAGFAMMKQELNKVVKNVEDLKNVLQKQYDNNLNFKFNEVQGSYVLSNPKNKYIKSFLPKTDHTINKRYDYLERVFKVKGLETDRESIQVLLKGIWTRFFEGENLLVDTSDYSGKRIDLSKYKIVNTNNWYRCSKCHRITAYNIENVCPAYRCEGKLEKIDVKTLIENNHYYKIYNELDVQPLL